MNKLILKPIHIFYLIYVAIMFVFPKFTYGQIQVQKGYILNIKNNKIFLDYTKHDVKKGTQLKVIKESVDTTNLATQEYKDRLISNITIVDVFDEYSVGIPYPAESIKDLAAGMKVSILKDNERWFRFSDYISDIEITDTVNNIIPVQVKYIINGNQKIHLNDTYSLYTLDTLRESIESNGVLQIIPKYSGRLKIKNVNKSIGTIQYSRSNNDLSSLYIKRYNYNQFKISISYSFIDEFDEKEYISGFGLGYSFSPFKNNLISIEPRLNIFMASIKDNYRQFNNDKDYINRINNLYESEVYTLIDKNLHDPKNPFINAEIIARYSPFEKLKIKNIDINFGVGYSYKKFKENYLFKILMNEEEYRLSKLDPEIGLKDERTWNFEFVTECRINRFFVEGSVVLIKTHSIQIPLILEYNHNDPMLFWRIGYDLF